MHNGRAQSDGAAVLDHQSRRRRRSSTPPRSSRSPGAWTERSTSPMARASTAWREPRPGRADLRCRVCRSISRRRPGCVHDVRRRRRLEWGRGNRVIVTGGVSLGSDHAPPHGETGSTWVCSTRSPVPDAAGRADGDVRIGVRSPRDRDGYLLAQGGCGERPGLIVPIWRAITLNRRPHVRTDLRHL